jgi:hypothetical protein
MPKTNAERQREFRKRKRERNGTVTAQIAATPVTPPPTTTRDYYDGADQIIWLGNWGYGDVWCRIVNASTS